jgi:hypothetical protein
MASGSLVRWGSGSLAVAAVLCAGRASAAATFAAAVTDYTMGNVFIASPGVVYNNTAAALGAPNPIVGSGAFAGNLSPFNAHYETSDLVAIGRGGAITLQLASPIPVGAGPEIGVVTNAYFADVSPGFTGTAQSPAHTAAFDEYGAERTAVVEVAATPGNFVSLGRVKFDKPANAFANATGPYDFPPAGAVAADYGKPFTGDLSAFSGKTYAEMLAILDGSAGGTWIDVPAGLGLSEVNFVRFSDTQWMLPDGSLATQRTSAFDNTFVKPADLFIDAVAGVPEPGLVGVTGLALIVGAARRRRPAR